VAARRAHPALASDDIRFYADDFPAEQVVRFDRLWAGEPGKVPVDFVAVALNFGGVARKVELTLPWPGRWQDLLSEQIYTVAQTCAITLAPWQAAVLTFLDK